MNKVKEARAILKTYRLKPNKSEQELLNLLNEEFPGEFIFNGGQITIEGKIPDFFSVNGKKQIIELAGRFHDWMELNERIKLFKKYGFNTLIIEYKELKDLDELWEKIFFWKNEGR